MNVLTACQPREDILSGTFNPEIFTASLSDVLRFYRGESTGVHSIYTDPCLFFKEATYPTDGMIMVLSEVFGRIQGDHNVPAIHRLETAFGGGKTHTLIACTHIAHKGQELSEYTENIIDSSILPPPGEISAVGIAGDEIPVHKPKGTDLIPYTLWGEIAYQIGGESLYLLVEDEVNSIAAPGKNYFEAVLKGRKVLIMLDELAQYAARLAAAQPNGGDQLAAFLMSLHGYARSNPGIAIVLTLASTKNAFANQTRRLAELIGQVTGKKVFEDDALGIGDDALQGISSVVARDATAVVPVQAAEISQVLSKRLFSRIDKEAAKHIVDKYVSLYERNMSELPQIATYADFRERMISHYPFHPTFIDFLNNKLSTSEDFQGTRGVLRVLSLCIRNIWNKQQKIPMIHTCHIDLKDARTVNEIIGRTGSGDLFPVLNADIGGVDTDGIEGGKSNAELADIRNPHPQGWPMYEYTWKTVFLHSLVGRDEGLGSNIFGLTDQDALFNVAFPELTPPQVLEALKEIENSAFYLRFNHGRYYASLEPSVNIALAKIRRTLSIPEIDQLLEAASRKVIKQGTGTFNIVTDVSAPEHIPDKQIKPTLALIALNAKHINITDCVTMAGPNTPRIDQNLVFLLVPNTVSTKRDNGEMTLFGTETSESEKSRTRLRELARTVLAMRKLREKPQIHGINPSKLNLENFQQRFSEREKALETMVTQSYNTLWFPSASGQIVGKEIRTAGGEGGISFIEQIRNILLEEGELVLSEHTSQSHLTSLAKIFFEKNDIASVNTIREKFRQNRSWPILESPNVLDQLIRAGVTRGIWCLFRMGADENVKPEEFYSNDTEEIPFDLDLKKDYSIVKAEGARKRGWTKDGAPDLTKTLDWVKQITSDKQIAKVSDIEEGVVSKFGNVPKSSINNAITELVKSGKLMTYKGNVNQEEKPSDMISDTDAIFYDPEPGDILITPARASEKGWITPKHQPFSLRGKEGREILFPLLRRLGSIYNRGATSVIDSMDFVEMKLPKGGRLRISLAEVPPESVKDLGELFETVSGLVQIDDRSEIYLDINHLDENCRFIQEIRKQSQKH